MGNVIDLRTRLALVPAANDNSTLRGGPSAARPCEGCPSRASCREPCELLEALVPPEEVPASREIGSPALMRGGGRDASCQVPHVALAPEEGREQWPAAASLLVPMIRRWVARLPCVQRSVVRGVLAGKSLAQIARDAGVTRQATHKSLTVARKELLRRVERYVARRGGLDLVLRHRGQLLSPEEAGGWSVKVTEAGGLVLLPSRTRATPRSTSTLAA